VVNKKAINTVLQFIKDKWPDCIVDGPISGKQSLALPHPYTAPCISGMFKELFYWDSYFTNLGLLQLGFRNLAMNNVEDLFHEIDLLGYVPNSSDKRQTNRSQPPYLAKMVIDLHESENDKVWLGRAYEYLKREYLCFWMKERLVPSGLNRYFHSATEIELLQFYDEISTRIPFFAQNVAEKVKIASHYLAEAETGWDFNPRFGGRCADFIPVDLNATLYAYEKSMERISEILSNGENIRWKEAATMRASLVDHFCWNDEDGFYYDYDFVHGVKSTTKSLAAFQPLWSGMASPAQAGRVKDKLPFFEYSFGLATCEKNGEKSLYQWDYPNGWAPLHYIACEGLRRYSFDMDAQRIERKYLSLVSANYGLTGELWEKYNVVDGSIHVVDEYQMPTLMDWTAGVFVSFALRNENEAQMDD